MTPVRGLRWLVCLETTIVLHLVLITLYGPEILNSTIWLFQCDKSFLWHWIKWKSFRIIIHVEIVSNSEWVIVRNVCRKCGVFSQCNELGAKNLEVSESVHELCDTMYILEFFHFSTLYVGIRDQSSSCFPIKTVVKFWYFIVKFSTENFLEIYVVVGWKLWICWRIGAHLVINQLTKR